MKRYLRHYIGDAWVESDDGTRHAVIDPATERPCTEITLGSAADVDTAVAAARLAFEGWSQTGVAERAALLERIIAQYKQRIADLAQAVSREMGAPSGFATAAQVPAGLGHFTATLKALDAFAFEERLGQSRVVHEPLGVVAMISRGLAAQPDHRQGRVRIGGGRHDDSQTQRGIAGHGRRTGLIPCAA